MSRMNRMPISQTVVISNTDNEPFLLSIDISQYGEFKPNELEIRVRNEFIEISGLQEWREVLGGANKRSFAQRHVLPNYIDLKGIYCRLLDNKTVLISAPSLSLVSKLTNSNQLKVDYVLGLDKKGLQFLKGYNLTSSSNSQTTSKSPSRSKDKINKEIKAKSNSSKDLTNMLFDLVKNPTRGESNSNSKLFSTEMGRKNVNFVNNLKSNGLKSAFNNKIHLSVDQLMRDKKEELRKSSAKKDEQSLNANQVSSTQPTSATKSKKRRSRRKKSTTDKNQSIISSDVDEVNKLESKKTESKSMVTDDKEINEINKLPKIDKKNEASSNEKKDVSISLTADKNKDLKDVRKKEEPKEQRKITDDKNENKEEKKDDSADDFKIIDVDNLTDCSGNDSLLKSQTSKDSSKSNKGIKGFSSYISSFLSSGNLMGNNNETSSDTSDEKPSQSINLVSCLKDKQDKSESKKEKHVMIELP